MGSVQVSIVGATGLAGRLVLEALAGRPFVGAVRLFASARSEGKVLHVRDAPVRVEALARAPDGPGLAIFAAGPAISREWIEPFRAAGAFVLDCSGYSSGDPEVPLVVPAVNRAELRRHRGVVALPDPASCIVATALAPLDKAFAVRRAVVTSLVPAAGAGARALAALEDEIRSEVFDDRPPGRPAPARRLAMNALPDASEQVGVQVSRLLGGGSIRVHATSVRVPIPRGFAATACVECDRPVQDLPGILRNAPDIVVMDKTPAEATGSDAVFVGRIGEDPTSPRAVSLWIAADLLWRGTALTAARIAEEVFER